MIRTRTNTISNEVVDYILQLPEVVDAKQRIDAMTEGSVSFHIPSTIPGLSHIFGLSMPDNIPMRWIKGDTKPHIDRSSTTFHTTFLAYLTDSTGQFSINGEIHPISKGTSYLFSEGQSHETIGTGTEPRLLLGPMSEHGIAVGEGYTINADGETQTIYMRYNSDISRNEYSLDQESWYTLYMPVAIYNTNPSPETHLLKCIFTTDIYLDGDLYDGNYSCFLCGTNGIQFGSTSLDANGNRAKVFVHNIYGYYGLIQNIERSHIYVFNIEVHATGTTNLALAAGWVGHTDFGVRSTNNYIVNCSSDGEISEQGGGIVGANAAIGDGIAGTSALHIIGCSSSGDIREMGGGIVGYNGASGGGYIKCEQCWSTGTMTGDYAGGIFGQYAGYSSGETVALKCYSTGAITGNFAGGIFGQLAGTSGTALADKCYSQGGISGNDAGGIYGSGAGSDGGITTATNCYSSGIVSTTGNGIYSGGENPSSRTIVHCYVGNNNWSDVDANNSLVGTPNSSTIVGDTWVSEYGQNMTYLLNGMGYSPYSTQNIQWQEGVASLNQSYIQTIYAGDTTAAAIKPNSNYTILNGNSFFTVNSVSGEITATNNATPGTYSISLYNTGSYNITTFALTIANNITPNLPICFPAGTPVLTDQGEVAIDKINQKIHTIRGKEIMAVTKSIPLDSYLICIERNSIGKNVPNKRTLISKDHKVLCDKKMMRAEYLAEYVPGVYKIDYDKKPLYNIVLREHSTMIVNNMVVETLHPDNILARIQCGKYTPQEKNKYILFINNTYLKNHRKTTMKSIHRR